MNTYTYFWFSKGPGRVLWCVKCENPWSEHEYDMNTKMCFECYMKDFMSKPYHSSTDSTTDNNGDWL